MTAHAGSVNQQMNKSKLKWGSNDLQQHAKMQERDKKRKHFELLLQTWESVQEKEREDKFSLLKRKVELQRRLIHKVDEQHQACIYHRQLKENKKKQKNKPTALAVQSTSKLWRTTVVKTPTVMVKQIDHDVVHSPSLNNDDAIPEISQVITDSVNKNTCKEQLQYPENRILKHLGMEQKSHDEIKIEEMWEHLKSFSDRKLKPMQLHLERLKRISSPSVKECLEVYNEPTSHDIHTGKPIGLSVTLNSLRRTVTPNKQQALKLSKSFATLKSKCGQIMIEKSQFVSDNDDESRAWFVGLNERPKSAPAKILMQRQDNNSLLSLFEQKLCFLKDINEVPSLKSFNTSTEIQDSQAIEHSSSNWQPLSLTALTEYCKVKERATTGHGLFRNGSASLWKQSKA